MNDILKFYNSSREIFEIAKKMKREFSIAEKKTRKFLNISVGKAVRDETRFRREYDQMFQIVEDLNKSLREIDQFKLDELKYRLNKLRHVSSKMIQDISHKYNHLNSVIASKASRK